MDKEEEMKNALFVLSCVVLLICTSRLAFAQENEHEWKIMPSVAIVKYFPGDHIRNGRGVEPFISPPIGWYSNSYNYSGTALNFTARCFNGDIKPLALTFGAGVNWYYEPDRYEVYPLASPWDGVGAKLDRQDFMTFPLSVGVQAVFPYASPENLMVFGGIEGNLHLISGNLNRGDQAKAGYSFVGGFAVKAFEFGVRYASFSDMSNLGVFFALRFKSFEI
jgi:hypothetical protein